MQTQDVTRVLSDPLAEELMQSSFRRDWVKS